ncbi:DUF2721 domain-containing protein [Croceicoccus sp. YJ47]|uniref:DUF2721 domain-containing protein n=1 Tax=Croceicoccus sp. YJ47 TaxID=2798724 RepID=UPI0019219D8E|nr:DUF2721 domain-containing protein [Croceicoccus sp. YJ47]QQN74200.1 DUF2721 domain-containing protein [Croceicoccus sp. YJ47]
MIPDILAVNTQIASDLVSRTASTARVQQILQLSLAPAFLLAAVAAMLNVMNQRLTWIVDRVERLERRAERGGLDREVQELPALLRRQKFAHVAINFSTGSALMICIVVSLMFVSAFIRPPLGTWVAAAWIAAMMGVFVSLLYFLLETQLATRSSRDRRRISRELRRREED